MRRRLSLGAPLLLAGCGSSWQNRGPEIEVDNALSWFYLDADGDDWGDPGTEPQGLREALVDQGYTATNGRDCDDAVADVTGRIGGMCPAGLVTVEPGADPIAYEGVVFDQSEFVYVFGGPTPVSRYTMGEESCTWWAGVDPADGGAWVARGGLATFGSQADVQAVQARVEASVAAGAQVYAGFVGIGWEGDLATGAWSFVDDSPDDVIEAQFTYCGATAPTPADFFPNLNPDDPDHLPAIEQELDRVRLALILQESGAWCLGTPRDAVPLDLLADIDAGLVDPEDPAVAELLRYTWTEGHFVCERAKPDAAAYADLSPVTVDGG